MFQISYFLPTNRVLQQNFNHLCDEVLYANETYDLTLPFVIVDDMSNSINSEIIREKKRDFKHIQFLYFNKDKITYIYDQIKKLLPVKEQKIFEKVYPDNVINYGNTFNKIFIISILLGNEMFIRRDSDVFFQKIKQNSEDNYLFPVDIELKYLSKKINNRNIYIVGGGYIGKWGIDIDDFVIDNDYTLVKEFLSCLLIPEFLLDDIIKVEIINNNKKYKEDSIEFDPLAYPQCGNVGYYKLFYSLPCSPAPYVIASDYFLLEAALEARFCVAYHNRTVIHQYTKDRNSSLDQVVDYWIRVLMWIDNKIANKKLFRDLNSKTKNNDTNQLDDNKFRNMILSIFSEINRNIPDTYAIRIEQYNKFLTILKKINKEAFLMAADYLTEQQDKIMKMTDQGLYEHCDLISIWGDIVDIICSLRKSKDIQNIINIL